MIISAAAQRVLKVLHLMAISFWIGGCLSLLALLVASFKVSNGAELYALLRGMNVVTLNVVVYLGAFGSFFTGLAYSLCTNRGFVRHRWIVLKWSLTICMMVAGTVLMAPKSILMMELALESGLQAQTMPIYLEARNTLVAMFILQITMLMICTVLSVYKPWEKEELANRYRHVRPLKS